MKRITKSVTRPARRQGEVGTRLSRFEFQRFTEACQNLNLSEVDLLRHLVRNGLDQIGNDGALFVSIHRGTPPQPKPLHRFDLYEDEVERLREVSAVTARPMEDLISAGAIRAIRGYSRNQGKLLPSMGAASRKKLAGVLCVRIDLVPKRQKAPRTRQPAETATTPGAKAERRFAQGKRAFAQA